MRKFEKITPAECRELREAITPVIAAAIADKYEGLTVEAGNSSYDGVSVTLKWTIKIVGKVNPEVLQLIDAYEWPKIGTTFNYSGRTFTIDHYDFKKRSNQLIAENGGKMYKFNPDDVKRLQGKEASAS